MREAQVLAAWRGGARDAGQIAARLYPDIAPVLRAAAAVQVRAHLAHLAQRGLVDGNDAHAWGGA
jgi:hypothetical protein